MSDSLDQGLFFARLSQYYERLDRLEDLSALRAMFSNSGTWEIYGLEGGAPILAFDPVDAFFDVAAEQASLARAARWRHHVTGMHTRRENETRARSWVKVLVTEQPDPAASPQIRETAVLDCLWVFEGGDWLIERLSIHPDGREASDG